MALAVIAAASPQPQNAKTGAPTNAGEGLAVQLRGRVVCLAEEMQKLHQTDLPTNHEHLYGFRTQEGKFYTLLRVKTSEALFADKRLHEKELIIKGRTFPQTQLLEATSLRSVRDGVVHDLYYYCVICDIQMISPGPCLCCQGAVELIEKPLPAARQPARPER